MHPLRRASRKVGETPRNGEESPTFGEEPKFVGFLIDPNLETLMENIKYFDYIRYVKAISRY